MEATDVRTEEGVTQQAQMGRATETEAATSAAPVPTPFRAPAARACKGVYSVEFTSRLKLHEQPEEPLTPEEYFSLPWSKKLSPQPWRCACCTTFADFARMHPDKLPMFEGERAAFSRYVFVNKPFQVRYCQSAGSCEFDGVCEHSHRGYFQPLWPLPCSGVAFGSSPDQCRQCQWLQSDTNRNDLWKHAKLGNTGLKSPLLQRVRRARKAPLRPAGTLPSAHSKHSLYTPDDWKATVGASEEALARETEARASDQRTASQQVAAAERKAREAARHQFTAESVSALATAERDSARSAASRAVVAAAEAQVAEQATARELGTVCEELAGTQAALHRERELREEDDEVAAIRLATERAKAQAQLDDERTKAQAQFDDERAKAQALAAAQRELSRNELAAAAERLAAERKQSSEYRDRARANDAAKDARIYELESENAVLRKRIKTLEAKLENSISRDDIPAFWLTILELYNEDKIKDKDVTLLKHLSARMKNARAAVSGATLCVALVPS